MKTVRRLLYREVVLAVVFVTAGFLSLFLFFDLVDELPAIGRGGPSGYQFEHALTYVLLLVPNHLYELLPITVLIGSIYVMARLAQSSEFTILRTSGLGPWLALRTLLLLGGGFVVLTFVLGDYLAPWADRNAQLLKARHQGNLTVGQTGAWLKERQQNSAYSVNVRSLSSDGTLRGVTLFEFDRGGQIRSLTQAEAGIFGKDGRWILQKAHRTEFNVREAATLSVRRQALESMEWSNGLSAEMVSAALLKPDRMRTVDLFTYIRHLRDNGQTAQRYEIEFWRKVFYPLSCLVMVVLALPFAYLHFRSGGITGYVFVGVIVGISFFLLNNVFGFVGNLQNWQPWLAAAAPGMLYSALSLAAFGWLVLRR